MLINPNNLFDVGFQLSYAAVFGIVFLQPKLEKQVMVKNKILKFFWSLITVSFAAQIATFPLTSFYFGQFPTYFWITNSFVIPAVMVLIPLGISLLFVSEIQFVAHILAVVLNTILKFTYLMLSKIEAFPYAVLEITVNQIQLILIVAMICSFLFFMKNQKVYFIKAALLFLLVLSISNLLRDIKQLNQTEVIVYNTPKNQSIHLIHRKENYIITDQKIAKDEIYYHPAIKTIQMMGLKNPVFLNSTDSFKNDHLKMKNQLAFFEGKSFSFNKNWSDLNKNKLPGFILNPAIQFTDSIHIKTNTTIISNKRYFNENNWESDKIHYTSVKGAFRKNW
jgi:competence protein ComEC